MDFKDLKKKLEDAVLAIADRETFNAIGKMSAESIRTRTRLGKGVDEMGGKLENLKALKTSTKDIRSFKKASGKLSNQTQPARSNLTETGELLDSIKYESTATEVRIYIDGVDNQKKAQDQVAQGRKFMSLSKTEVNAVIKYISNRIRDSFNKG